MPPAPRLTIGSALPGDFVKGEDRTRMVFSQKAGQTAQAGPPPNDEGRLAPAFILRSAIWAADW